MKKIILVITSIFFLISCDPAKFMCRHSGFWYIKNNLDYPINVSVCNRTKQIILPTDSLEFLYYRPFVTSGDLHFDALLSERTWEAYSEQDIRIDIISEKGEVLKAWNIRGKDESGKHLFKEEYWRLYIEKNGDESNRYYWVFDIVHEDIDKNK